MGMNNRSKLGGYALTNFDKKVWSKIRQKNSKEDLLTHVMGNKTKIMLANLFSNFISKCFSVKDECPWFTTPIKYSILIY